MTEPNLVQLLASTDVGKEIFSMFVLAELAYKSWLKVLLARVCYERKILFKAMDYKSDTNE